MLTQQMHVEVGRVYSILNSGCRIAVTSLVFGTEGDRRARGFYVEKGEIKKGIQIDVSMNLIESTDKNYVTNWKDEHFLECLRLDANLQ